MDFKGFHALQWHAEAQPTEVCAPFGSGLLGHTWVCLGVKLRRNINEAAKQLGPSYSIFGPSSLEGGLVVMFKDFSSCPVPLLEPWRFHEFFVWNVHAE